MKTRYLLSLLAGLGMVVTLTACGGGEGSGDPTGQSSVAVLTVYNAQNTYFNQYNEHDIVTVSIGGQTFNTHIEPGSSAGFQVTAGDHYTVNVTYEDGQSEYGQSPGDPVEVGSDATVSFWHW